MAENLPGPYEIEFDMLGWSSPAREHVHRINVACVGTPAIGALPTAINIQKMGGGSGTLNVVANQYWEFMRLFYPAAITTSGYILWKYVVGTLGKTFISSGTVTNPAGNGAAIVAASQLTLTYRSALGGIMKQVLLEPNLAGSNRIPLIPNAAGASYQRMAAYIMSADNIALARDDGFPIAPMHAASGENERMFRKLYRT